MKHSPIGPAPSQQETLNGFGYLAFEILILPTMLQWGNVQLGSPLNLAETNFLYYFINFMAMLVLFHRFLGKNFCQALQHPILLCQAVILGLVAYRVSEGLVNLLVGLLAPGFTNLNDDSIAAMESTNSFLMSLGAVVLVPPVEECFFRGLIFRNLYGKSKWAAYGVSSLCFGVIHTLGYLGLYSPLELVLAVVQYLPAGIWLGWVYTKSGTIAAPIFMHAAVNFFAVSALR